MKKLFSVLTMCFALTLVFLPSKSQAAYDPLQSVKITAIGDNTKMYRVNSSNSSTLTIPPLKGDNLYVTVYEVGTPDSYSEFFIINNIKFLTNNLRLVNSYSSPFGTEKTYSVVSLKDNFFRNSSNSINQVGFQADVPFTLEKKSDNMLVHLQ